MNSMTGYGRGEATRNGAKFTAEISTVNRRQTDLSLYLPRELEALESRARDEVNNAVARGRVTVRIGFVPAHSGSGRAKVNVALAKGFAREYRQLAKDLKLKDDVGIESVLRAPGVLQAADEALDVEGLWPALRKALRAGLRELLAMRATEGAHLKKDLSKRIANMRKAVKAVGRCAPKTVERHRRALMDRLAAAGLGLDTGDERVLKELAVFADRIDISEELTRLESHFKQFADCTNAKAPVGRTLDFLSQEMNREINTIGSKANDADISALVVQLKSELEKFREQVQNVE